MYATMAHPVIPVVMQQFKHDAKIALQAGKYTKAFDLYTKAIETVTSIQGFHQTFPEDVAQLYGNRSLVLFKISNFRQSLEDACKSVIICSKYAKGYYRQGMAYRELNCLQNAVDCFISAIEVREDDECHITCFTEIIRILCEKEEIDNLKLLPDPKNDIKQPILERLASIPCWKGVNYLIVGAFDGVDSKLNGGFSKCDCSKLSVIKLLKDTTIQQKREWALKLATMMFLKGSSFADFESTLKENVIHYAINLSKEIDNVDFLRYLLSKLLTQEQKDRKDEDGNTGIHVVVKSNIITTTLGLTILGILINHECDPRITDSCGKTPIEYLTESDQAYALIQNSLRRHIESVKNKGNQELKGGNLESAFKLYTGALELCGSTLDFRRERAVLYSNRANIYSKLEQHDLALKDAMEAIAADNTWEKGYWRKGQELSHLCQYEEAFDTWTGAVNINGISTKTLVDLVTDAAKVFTKLEDRRKIDRYNAFYSNVSSDVWSKVLIRLSKSEDWLAVRYLILGTSVERSKSGNIEGVGVACQSDTTKLYFGTIFTYLEKQKHTQEISTWLTPTLLILLFTKDQNYLNFKSGTNDTCIHASVRYALITGDVNILEKIPIKVTPYKDEYLDGRKESPYHVVTKYKHSNDSSIMQKVSLILQKNGYTASMKDSEGRLPIDYITQEEHSELYKVLSKITRKGKPNIENATTFTEYKTPRSPQTRDCDFFTLVQLADQEHSNKCFENALQIYSRALEVQAFSFWFDKDFDVANVHSEMARCYLELGRNDLAWTAAHQSIHLNPNCIMAYISKGEVLERKGMDDQSFDTFVKAISITTTTEFHANWTENGLLAMEIILKSVCVPYERLHTANSAKYPENLLARLGIDRRPFLGIWLYFIYPFVLENKLSAAKFAFDQLKYEVGIIFSKRDFDLRRLCDLGLIKQCPWLIVYIQYLLQWCLCDYKQLSTEPGDTYFHAVVRMTLISGDFSLLQLLSGQSNTQDDSLSPFLCRFTDIQNNTNMVDTFGNTVLHAATSMKLEDNSTRYPTISFLISLGIDSDIVNNDGKVAVDYLPKKDKKSMQIITRYMKNPKVRAHSLKANASVSHQLQDTVQKCVHVKSNSRSDNEQNTNHKPVSEEDRCSSCKQKLNWCQNNIFSDGEKSIKEIIKVIRNSKHKSSTHKGIVEKCIAFIADVMMKDGTTFETCDDLYRLPRKQFKKIIEDLFKKRQFLKGHELIKKYSTKYNGDFFTDFAKDIKMDCVIEGLITEEVGCKELFTRKEEMLEDFFRNGGVLVESGKHWLELAVRRKQYWLALMLLRQTGVDPKGLSLTSGDTPIHAAFRIALLEDIGNFSIFNTCADLYLKQPDAFAHLNPNQQDSDGNTLFHVLAKEKSTETTIKGAEILHQLHVCCKVQNKEGKFPTDYLKVSDPRAQIFMIATKYEIKPKKGKKNDIKKKTFYRRI